MANWCLATRSLKSFGAGTFSLRQSSVSTRQCVRFVRPWETIRNDRGSFKPWWGRDTALLRQLATAPTALWYRVARNQRVVMTMERPVRANQRLATRCRLGQFPMVLPQPPQYPVAITERSFRAPQARILRGGC